MDGHQATASNAQTTFRGVLNGFDGGNDEDDEHDDNGDNGETMKWCNCGLFFSSAMIHLTIRLISGQNWEALQLRHGPRWHCIAEGGATRGNNKGNRKRYAEKQHVSGSGYHLLLGFCRFTSVCD